MLLFAAPGDWGEGTSGTGSKLDNWRRLRSSRSLAGGVSPSPTQASPEDHMTHISDGSMPCCRCTCTAHCREVLAAAHVISRHANIHDRQV